MNWTQRIDDAQKRGHFRDADIDLAGEWVTCACGEQDKDIPRNIVGCPLDDRLEELGIEFMNAVEENNFNVARSILVDIQTRAFWVLKAQGPTR